MPKDQEVLCGQVAVLAKEKFLELYKQRPRFYNLSTGQAYSSKVSFNMNSCGDMKYLSLDTESNNQWFDLLSRKSLGLANMPVRENGEELRIHVTFDLKSDEVENLSVKASAEQPQHK